MNDAEKICEYCLTTYSQKSTICGLHSRCITKRKCQDESSIYFVNFDEVKRQWYLSKGYEFYEKMPSSVDALGERRGGLVFVELKSVFDIGIEELEGKIFGNKEGVKQWDFEKKYKDSINVLYKILDYDSKFDISLSSLDKYYVIVFDGEIGEDNPSLYSLVGGLNFLGQKPMGGFDLFMPNLENVIRIDGAKIFYSKCSELDLKMDDIIK